LKVDVLCAFRLAYVRQEDLFFSQLTVRETLSLAAELQLPRTWKSKAKDRYVDELLYRLGLVGAIPWIIAIMWNQLTVVL
jgi:ABC-type multidrug transport system ATPase subunit